VVESRRGGGGYIRIIRVRAAPEQLIMHTVNAVGEELDLPTAAAFLSNAVKSEALDAKSAKLILAAVGNQALRPVPPELRGAVRASIVKRMLVETLADHY